MPLLGGGEPQEGKSVEGEKTPQIQKIRVVAERFSFTPSRIKVKEGTVLQINLSSDDTFHGFRILSTGIDHVIPARGRGVLRVMFEANKKGTYAFECSRSCGAGHTMMRGVIVVE